MILKLFLLYLSVVLINAAFEGESCVKDGKAGVCINLRQCQAAINDIRDRKNPQICSFSASDPIVCCVNSVQGVQSGPVATTVKPKPSTTEYVPAVYDYETADKAQDTCEALPLSMTPKKTGQKAFDKCIDYQELVYPCEKSVALVGDKSRSSHCYHNADDLIIGGHPAGANEFPHMALVGYGADIDAVEYLCGGTLISDRFVLTAGHCISSRDLGPITYVAVGVLRRSDVTDASKVYKVKNIIKHPEYKPPIKYNDIALVETEKQIKLNQFVVPACIHTGAPVNDDRVTATGWGLTAYGGSVSPALQKVILQKFSTAECSQKFPVSRRQMARGFDPETQTCYGDKDTSKDTCQGDSGGPIQIKSKNIHCMYTIVGVTSFGKACGFVGEPGIYTRVAAYTKWIEDTVWK